MIMMFTTYQDMSVLSILTETENQFYYIFPHQEHGQSM